MMHAAQRPGAEAATLGRAITFDDRAARLDPARPDPRPAEGEALIKLQLAAISASDLRILRGGAGFTGVPGQEFVGVVEQVNGERAAAARFTGKRVVAAAATACGRCERCVAGLKAHCRKRALPGLSGRDGCLADRFTLPLSCLALVPDSVDNDRAVFAVELAAALQAARQLTIAGKPYITVLGDGPLAMLTAQVMTKLNASVRVIGWHEAGAAMCEKLGLKHRSAGEVGRRADQDVVVECTGAAAGLSLAMQLVRPRGKIVMKSITGCGGAEPGSSGAGGMDLAPLVLHEIELIGSFAGPVEEAVAMLERGEVNVLPLIGRRFRFEEALAALRAAGQPGAMKVLLET